MNKENFKRLIILGTLLSIICVAYAQIPVISYQFTLYQFQLEEEPDNGIAIGGHRSLVPQFTCTISEEDGVSISSVNTEDIVSYEISSAETNQVLASFTTEDDFVDYLFTNPGAYLVSFTTEDYIYSGYIEL